MSAFLGDLRDGWQMYLCGYTASPDGFHCDRDAAWHGFLLDDAGCEIAAMMSSCDEHLPHMRKSADYVHALKHPCGIPGSMFRWPENECYADWDEAELTAEQAMAGAGRAS